MILEEVRLLAETVAPYVVAEDWIVGTMNLLRNKWSLTGSLSSNTIKFTTGLYQEQLNTPQISVTPLVEPYRTINIGPTPMYRARKRIQIQLWIKPKTDSNSALGL